MDAFYVSVELRRRPELRGLPVIVSGDGPRAVVTTASYEARRFGVGSAMPTARARRMCPTAILVRPDFSAYREASTHVMQCVRAAVPGGVQVMGLDEAYLDLSEMVAPRAAMRRLVAEIGRRTGLACSVGIGPNKLVAKVASDADKPHGFLALSVEQARARFATTSPSLLPGIGPKTAARLAEMGITTIETLAAADEAALGARFGPRTGAWLVARARFEDVAAVGEAPVSRSESCERTFSVDVADHSEQEQILDQLSRRLADRLAAQGRYGRTIAIKVRLDDFTTVTRARTAPVPVIAGEQISAVAVELLREYAPGRPVRLLGVRMAGFGEPDGAPRASQLALEL
ncbi:MAG: DNA polymerase IV [Solirubrobacterales bacterium]|nr:MAG: DNA polymerase IV [Solirubrobacterales bacterium]